MNVNKMLLAALAGGVAYFFLGWIVWGMALAGIMEMPADIKAAVGKEPMAMWAMILSCLVYGLLIALIYERWAGIRTFLSGAKAGAILGGLISLSIDLNYFSMTKLWTTTQIAADVAGSIVVGAIVGGLIGWVLGYGRKP